MDVVVDNAGNGFLALLLFFDGYSDYPNAGMFNAGIYQKSLFFEENVGFGLTFVFLIFRHLDNLRYVTHFRCCD
jgi:hypothetical protein